MSLFAFHYFIIPWLDIPAEGPAGQRGEQCNRIHVDTHGHLHVDIQWIRMGIYTWIYMGIYGIKCWKGNIQGMLGEVSILQGSRGQQVAGG